MSTSHEKTPWDQTLSRVLEFFPLRGISRILLYGPPGTGKTSVIPNLLSRDYCRVQMNECMEPEEMFVFPKIHNGDTIFIDGQVTRAMRNGLPLLLDEIDKHSLQTRSSLHAILDDPSLSRITIPTGETIRPSEGFGVVATMNGNPNDLPEAIIDRFDVVLCCDLPHSSILSSLPESFSKFLTGVYESRNQRILEWTPEVSTRRMIVANRLINSGMPKSEAFRLVFHDLANDVESAIISRSL